MFRFLIITIVALSCGCAFIKPTTEFSFNPATGQAHFIDTKDNRVQVKDFKVEKKEDGTFGCSFTEMLVENQSSPVINANVNQMLAFAEQQRAANEGIKASFEGLTTLAREIVPALGLLQGSGSSPGLVDKFQQSLTKIEQIRAVMQSATKPQPTTAPTN